MIILLALSEHDKAMTLEAIANECEINKSTCVHILETLQETGFVDRISRSTGYQLKPFCFELARSGQFHNELIHLCHPVMRWLYNKIHETVLLTILYKDDKLIIHHLTGKRPLSPDGSEFVVGNHDFYATGTARALLAAISLDKTKFKQIYKRLGLPKNGVWPEVTDYDSLMTELKQIRNRGYSKVRDPDYPGYGYGAVLYDQHIPIAAIGVASLGEDKDDTQVIKNLLIAAKEINRRLDFSTLTDEQ